MAFLLFVLVEVDHFWGGRFHRIRVVRLVLDNLQKRVAVGSATGLVGGLEVIVGL